MTTVSHPLPVARQDLLLRRVGSEWVLFDSRQNRAHVLNLTAAVVWTYCDGGHATGDIAAAIARKVEGSHEPAIADDVEAVLRRFADEGLLQ